MVKVAQIVIVKKLHPMEARASINSPTRKPAVAFISFNLQFPAGMGHMRVVKVGEINQKKAAEASFARFPSTSNGSGPSTTCRDCSYMIEKCQEQDKKIRNLQNQNQRLIKELEYYKRNHAINIKAEQGGGGIGIE